MPKKKKKKKKPQAPPLSRLDKLLYFSALAILTGISIAVAISHAKIQSTIAHLETSVVAYTSTASAVLLPLPFFILLFLCFLIPLARAYFNRKPIFGNEKYKYGEYPWEKDLFPMFGKQHKAVFISPEVKSLRRKSLTAILVILVITALMLPFSFCGRNSLRDDKSIIICNSLNQTTSAYSLTDYSHVMIRAVYRTSGRSHGHWEYMIQIIMSDGQKFSFSNRDFEDNTTALIQMNDIKNAMQAGNVSIEGESNLNKVIEKYSMTSEQIALLYELFNIKE